MHGHSHGGPPGAELRTAAGIRAAQWSTLGLLIVGVIEITIFALGNSAGLLADAVHNLGDVSTTLAIWVAFTYSRRPASERYPYGYHGAEDLAAVFVLVVMTASAVAAGYGSIEHLITGQHPTHLLLGGLAAIAGFAGNELVGLYKLRVGRRIGSISLRADGVHSAVDGLVSLAALAGILGVAAGWNRADGLAGLLITVVIAGVLFETARGVLGRSLDAVDPALTAQVRASAAAVPLVQGVEDVHVRWAGRALFVTLAIALPPDLTLAQAHTTAEDVRHALLHDIENLREAEVHMDPAGDYALVHAATAHHDDNGAHEHDDEHDDERASKHSAREHDEHLHGDDDDHDHDHAEQAHPERSALTSDGPAPAPNDHAHDHAAEPHAHGG
jgi:cation diffusion facilitator family transporter